MSVGTRHFYILYLLLSLDDKTCELCAPLSSTRFAIHYESDVDDDDDDDNNDVDSSGKIAMTVEQRREVLYNRMRKIWCKSTGNI